MRIPIVRQAGMPLYRQIASHLRQSILSGALPTDTRLPSTRQLARDLGVNRITAETAYSELEADGLIAPHPCSGTYVLPLVSAPSTLPRDPSVPWPLWQTLPSTRTDVSQHNNPEEMLMAAGHKQPLNFAAGVSDSRLFPSEEFRKVIHRVMRRDGSSSLEYGDRRGYKPLRETIAQVLASQGLSASAENILITSGSQQALAITAQLLLRPSDIVLVENPTYAGALDLFRSLSLTIIGIPMDESGMRVDKLERLLQRHHPKLIYTIPSFHNPTGACLPRVRRQQLIELADRYNVPILEDDYVGDLRYEGRSQPALKSLDRGGGVIYVSTFSKMLMPGLRLGFLVADGPIYESLAAYKRVNDLGSSNLIQRGLEAYVTVGRYEAHLRRSRRIYRKRRDAMLAALGRYFPKGVSYTMPQGGLFIWVRLPEGLCADKLLPLACQNGISFACGNTFYIGNTGGEGYIRLSFAIHSPEEIEEGIRRLGKLMK